MVIMTNSNPDATISTIRTDPDTMISHSKVADKNMITATRISSNIFADQDRINQAAPVMILEKRVEQVAGHNPNILKP